MRVPNAVRASAWAAMALASLECVPPPAVHGLGKPVIEEPGLTPTAPEAVVEPVQVTAAPPRTEYPDEPASVGEVAASTLAGATATSVNTKPRIAVNIEYLFIFFISGTMDTKLCT